VQVAARQALHLREVAAEVGGEAVDDLGAPSFPPLAVEDVAPDLPVELDELAVDRERGASAGSRGPGLDLGKELRVVGRQLRRSVRGGLGHGSMLRWTPALRRPWCLVCRGRAEEIDIYRHG
jgi:hypothetical protein